jgi:NAD(P)-dependent dehydrogenase (short-subunit alcohol dehydrogenase family)
MSTIVVTGSASGIGAATAARLERDGHDVIGVDVRDADVIADLSTPDGRAAVIAAITEPLDGIVTCAGLGPLPSRPGSAIVGVNYFGSVALLDGLRPRLRADGAAVAISSNSTTCSPGVPEDLADLCLAGDEVAALVRADQVGGMGGSYPASKLAVARWVRTRAVSADWIGAGIRLNAVAPGLIETALIAEGRADPTVGPLLDLFPIPAGRPGQPDEVAALIAFLLGSEASLLCGSIVFADGGTDALLRGNDWPSPWEPDPATLGALFNPPH